MIDNLSKFKGLGVAMVTPFLPSGQVDYPRLEALVENLVNNLLDQLLNQRILHVIEA